MVAPVSSLGPGKLSGTTNVLRCRTPKQPVAEQTVSDFTFHKAAVCSFSTPANDQRKVRWIGETSKKRETVFPEVTCAAQYYTPQ